jgi:hypothetical protein
MPVLAFLCMCMPSPIIDQHVVAAASLMAAWADMEIVMVYCLYG